jgi:16S rRNA (guanine966-N2)-methyltransferase
VEVRRGDGLEFARAAARAFDIVFLDPPFDSDALAVLTPLLPRISRSGGMVYVESARGVRLDERWQLYRQARAGHVTYQLFRHGDH